MCPFKEIAKKYKPSYEQIIKEHWILANDPSTPASVQNEIYKEFVVKLEEIENAESDDENFVYRAVRERGRIGL